MRRADVEAGLHVPVLRRLCELGIAVVGAAVRLAVGHALGEGVALHLDTKGLRLLGEESVLITRAVENEFVVQTDAEGVVIEKVAIRPAEGCDCGCVSVSEGSATVKDCDLRGQANVNEGAELLLQTCTVHDCATAALVVDGIAVSQDCILQDCPAGTTVRRCMAGLMVKGKAMIGQGCSISACIRSGVYAWMVHGGPGEVTVEEGVGLVCEGNNTNNEEGLGNFVSADGAPITGVAEELIVHDDD